MRVEDFYFDELMVLIEKGKGGKSRYVPILAELAQELRTHLGDRETGYIFESNRNSNHSARRISTNCERDGTAGWHSEACASASVEAFGGDNTFRAGNAVGVDSEVLGTLED